jgi:hypothetical protein
MRSNLSPRHVPLLHVLCCHRRWRVIPCCFACSYPRALEAVAPEPAVGMIPSPPRRRKRAHRVARCMLHHVGCCAITPTSAQLPHLCMVRSTHAPLTLRPHPHPLAFLGLSQDNRRGQLAGRCRPIRQRRRGSLVRSRRPHGAHRAAVQRDEVTCAARTMRRSDNIQRAPIPRPRGENAQLVPMRRGATWHSATCSR